MSVSLAQPLAHRLPTLSEDVSPPDLAGDPFAAGPGVIIVLIVLAVLLVAAIGRAMAMLWQLIRQAVALLGTLVIGLAAVVVLGSTAVSGSGLDLEPFPTVTVRPSTTVVPKRPAPRPRPTPTTGSLAPSLAPRAEPPR